MKLVLGLAWLLNHKPLTESLWDFRLFSKANFRDYRFVQEVLLSPGLIWLIRSNIVTPAWAATHRIIHSPLESSWRRNSQLKIRISSHLIRNRFVSSTIRVTLGICDSRLRPQRSSNEIFNIFSVLLSILNITLHIIKYYIMISCFTSFISTH